MIFGHMVNLGITKMKIKVIMPTYVTKVETLQKLFHTSFAYCTVNVKNKYLKTIWEICTMQSYSA